MKSKQFTTINFKISPYFCFFFIIFSLNILSTFFLIGYQPFHFTSIFFFYYLNKLIIIIFQFSFYSLFYFIEFCFIISTLVSIISSIFSSVFSNLLFNLWILHSIFVPKSRLLLLIQSSL